MLGKREIKESKNEPKKIHQISVSITDPNVPDADEENNRKELLRTFKSTQKEEEDLQNLIAHLKLLFNLRPVWLKSSIEAELSTRGVKYSSDFTLKKALAVVSYLFKNGPWKFTYVRFGYDPRHDKAALDYQTFNIGIGNSFFMSARTNSSMTEFKRRNHQNQQLCEVSDPPLQRILAQVKKDLSSNHHAQADIKTGWLDKKCAVYVSRRLKEGLKKRLRD